MIFNLIHNSSETVGLIGDAIKSLRLPSKDVHLYDGEGLPRDISDLEGLVVMGGPMSVNDVCDFPFLISELQLIEKVLSENKPVLGVCLGAQLIAKALGSRVYVHKTREVGWHPIQLTPQGKSDVHFKNIPSKTAVFQWHGETFDLPPGAVHLAQSDRCAAQAFRWGESTYGIQFHLEVTPSIIRSWFQDKEGKAYAIQAGENPQKIIQSTRQHYDDLQPIAMTFFNSYLKSVFAKTLSAA